MGCCMASHPLETPDSVSAPSLEMHRPEGLLIRAETFFRESDCSLHSKYRLGRLLGKGTFGNVYEATHLASGTKRAVKIISRELVSDAAIGSMMNEVALLKSLVLSTQDHPHILKIYEVLLEQDTIDLVFELLSGGELYSKIAARQRMDEEVVREYMQQILSAVAYCHDRHIVHRDLKPENIVFESRSVNAMLKIIDFGISRRLSPTGTLSKAAGTVSSTQPYYLAPEVKSGNYDEKCDLWSCGVMACIMLSGMMPLSPEMEECFDQLHTGRLDFNKDYWAAVSEEAKDFLTQILQTDPKARPSARGLLSHPWLKAATQSYCTAGQETLHRLQTFAFSSRLQSDKLKQAALSYIATQLTTVQETEQIRRLFIAMDEDGDGRLSKEEVIKGLGKVKLKHVNVERVMRDCDSDKSGYIDYTEFLTASMNWQLTLDDLQIETAFAAFDEDRDGRIDMKELQQIFPDSNVDPEDPIWRDILLEVDGDGDGCIDIKEFKRLIRRKPPPSPVASLQQPL